MDGHSSIEEVSDSEAIRVTDYYPDITPPTNIRFTVLDINSGYLQIAAEEPLSNEVVVENISLQSMRDNDMIKHRLSGGIVSYLDTDDRREIRIYLLDPDFQAIKLITQLGSLITNSFISIENGTLQDVSNNLVSAVPSSSALPLESFIADTTSPELTSFDLDLDSGVIHATFNDIVDSETLMATRLSVVGSMNPTENDTYTLTGGYTNSSNGFNIDIQIIPYDLNAIKSNTLIATMKNDTFVSISAELIEDLANLSVQRTTLMVEDYFPDETNPQVNGFELNVNDGTLIISFSEAIDPNSTDVTQIRIQSGIDHNSDQFVELRGGEIETNDINTIFTILFDEDDLNFIKQQTELGTTENNTYLSITSLAAKDFSGNEINEISLTNAMPAEGHSIDTTAPTLVHFDFDLDSGILLLTFSETVQGSSLMSDRLILQSANDSIPDEVHTLSFTNSHSNENSIIVSLTTPEDDLNTIKSFATLATSNDTTYLRHLSGAIRDTSEQSIATLTNIQAVQARNFTPDTTPPKLDSFILDLNGSNTTLMLTFSETILSSTLNISRTDLIKQQK